MSDIHSVLPDFPTAPYTHLLPSLERAHICTADLLCSDALDVAKAAQLPARQVRRLREEFEEALRGDLGISGGFRSDGKVASSEGSGGRLRCSALELRDRWKTVSCLDEGLDRALGGGFPTGVLTEVTGESGIGKTQLLLTLLLSAQLPPPHGLSRSSIYISTESPLQTSRLAQLLTHHPVLSALPPAQKPSLSRILSIQVPDLESQDHILRYQLPVAIKRHGIGLVVVDSITANFRAEFESRGGGGRTGPGAMATRSAMLVGTGALLRATARRDDVAIVVANQVADRFEQQPQPQPQHATPATMPAPTQNPTPDATPRRDAVTLDHQQRWFTGWGDEEHEHHAISPKTPSLGLVWANQIAARIALVKRVSSAAARPMSTLALLEGRAMRGRGEVRTRRFMKVVFAPWAADDAGRAGTEFVVEREGVRAVAVGSQGAARGSGGDGDGQEVG